MILKQHKNLTLDRWNKFTHTQKILMIGNELNRAKGWLRKSDYSEVKNCYERCFELLDLTIETTRRKGELKELLRFREKLAELYIQKIPSISVTNNLYKALILFDKDAFVSLTLKKV